jgi:hypothetical protein
MVRTFSWLWLLRIHTDVDAELSIAPHLNAKLVPAHIKPELASRGLDIDNFTPMAKSEMIAKLD